MVGGLRDRQESSKTDMRHKGRETGMRIERQTGSQRDRQEAEIQKHRQLL